MKKMLIVALALMLTVCMSATAFAGTDSPVSPYSPTYLDSPTASATTTTATSTVTVAELLAALTAAGIDADNATILWTGVLASDEHPFNVSFKNVMGVTEADTLYLLMNINGVWTVIASGKGPSLTAQVAQDGAAALIVVKGAQAPAASASGNAPKTGEQNMVLFAGVVMMMAAAVAFMAYKKEA